MEAPVLHIHLLGNLDVHYEGQPPITSLNSSRLQTLLAYLLIHRHSPQPRSHLAYLLWPDSSEDQALTNLRNLYHLLRQAFPRVDDYIQADRQTLHWRPERPFSLDVEDFEAAITQAKAPQEHNNLPNQRLSLEKAENLYQDDLLVSCYSDWILPERERLRQLFLEAAYRLVGLLADLGESTRAIQTANSLLRFDPLQEVAYRRLMELYALKGDRAGIERTYHTCVALLERELSIQPSPVTRHLYQRLLNSPEIVIEPAAEADKAKEQECSFGRQVHMEQLQSAWTKAAAAGPQFALVSGEAGLGKSRLLSDFSRRIRQAGGRVAEARCFSGEGRLAFAPLVAWLHARALPPLDKAWLAELARLLPEVQGALPDLPAIPAPLENWQRARLFEAIARALLDDRQPVLLVLDDLHWVDRNSLDWLRYILHFDAGARLLIVSAVRPEELRGRCPLQNFLSDVRQSESFYDVKLSPLDPDETAALGGQTCGNPLPAEAAMFLYQNSLGNPFYAKEMAANAWAYLKAPNGGASGLTPIPPAVEALLRARLERITPAAGEILNLVAAVGQGCPYSLLEQAAGLDERRLVDALEELVERGLLAEEQPTTNRVEAARQRYPVYRFSHPLLRQVAWTRISSARRHLLECAVQRLERTPTQ